MNMWMATLRGLIRFNTSVSVSVIPQVLYCDALEMYRMRYNTIPASGFIQTFNLNITIVVH